MNGIILAIALMGQPAQPRDLAVRIQCPDGSGAVGYGTGTILASNEPGEELVLTARHVTEHARWVLVEYRGKAYRAKHVYQSARADLAAIDVDLPGTFSDVPIGRSPGKSATIWGYGQSGGLHQHSMNYTGHSRMSTGGVGPYVSQDYTPGGNEGDSGAGVWNDAGELSGVFVAKEKGTRNAAAVAAVELCQFISPRTTASGSKRIVIFPFFWARSQWGNGSVSSCPPGQTCPPIQRPIVQPEPLPSTPVGTAGIPGAQGPQGIQGLPGKDGAPGKDAPQANIDALTARVAALEKSIDGILTTTNKVAAAVVRPITVNVAKSDGTVSTAQAQLGSTINLDVADKAIVARLAAIEARLSATPTK